MGTMWIWLAIAFVIVLSPIVWLFYRWYKAIQSEKDTITAYMCLVDWKYEVPYNSAGNRIYYSLDAIKEQRSCVDECGIVELEVTFVKAIQPERM